MPANRRKILNAVYNTVMKDKLSLKNQRLVGIRSTVRLTFDWKAGTAYTYLEKPEERIFRIVIGGDIICQMTGMPEEFKDKKAFLPYREGIVKSFFGLDYHEMGHILFTDMSDPIIVDYPKPQYRDFLHQLFNIIEDPIQEKCLVNHFRVKYPTERSPKIFFNYLIEKIFQPQCAGYKDDGSLGAFMNYILLTMRCGKTSIPTKNKVWEKYEKDLLPQIKDIIYDGDGTSRLHKCVKLGEWIIENIKEFHFDKITVPEREKMSGSMKGGGSGSPAHGDTSDDGEKGAGKDELDSKGGKSSKEGEGGEGFGKDSSEATDLGEAPEMDDIFNDFFPDEDYHEWVVAKDEYQYDDNVIDDIEKQIEESSDLVNDVARFLKLFTDRVKPRVTPGFTSGKLNMRRAMQDDLRDGCDTHIFNRYIKRGQDIDLAVSLVCDNSGSMSGMKSEICSQAALALAQACDWVNIPFECNAFTKTSDTRSGVCITIKIKDFEDSFQEAKPFFAINDSSLIGKLDSYRGIPTFCGNSEEVNLYYIGQEFSRNPHRNKLMLVFCDGRTTGSVNDLSRVVKDLEAQGITVIGIGICDNGVDGPYKTNKVFSSYQELQEGLSQYLIDTLEKAATGM